MEEHSIDADELNQEFPPEQYTDGHVVEVIKERLDKPEEGKVYSLHKLSETQEWSSAEVKDEVTSDFNDFDDLFEGI